MTDADRLVADYVKELEKALAGIPRVRRREVVAEIETHIAEARAVLVSPTDADVRNLLDRVGEPVEIAADAHERFGVGPGSATWRELAALILLPIGGIVLPVVGWVVGVVLLWASQTWTMRDKLIGTLVLPGGLLFPIFALGLGIAKRECTTPLSPGGARAGASECSTGGTGLWLIVTMVVLAVAPIASAIYLARRMGSYRP